MEPNNTNFVNAVENAPFAEPDETVREALYRMEQKKASSAFS